MGLDLLEFTLAIEESFGLYLPEADAVRLTTPGQVIDYLAARLPPAATPQCLDQLAFHQVRRAAMHVLDKPRHVLNPDTPWKEVLLPEHRRRQWQLIGQVVGLPRWPRLTPWGTLPKDVQSMGGTARFLAMRCPNAVKGSSPTWTRLEITQVVTSLMAEELGVTSFSMSDRFVQDLGLS
jgi:hypothetical protein